LLLLHIRRVVSTRLASLETILTHSSIEAEEGRRLLGTEVALRLIVYAFKQVENLLLTDLIFVWLAHPDLVYLLDEEERDSQSSFECFPGNLLLLLFQGAEVAAVFRAALPVAEVLSWLADTQIVEGLLHEWSLTSELLAPLNMQIAVAYPCLLAGSLE